MSQKPITMLQIRRILQLLKEKKSKRHIALALHLGRNTVNDYAERIEKSGLSIAVLLKLADADLGDLLYPKNEHIKSDKRAESFEKKVSDFQNELTRVGVTKLLLWNEYRKEFPDGYGYSQFCDRLNAHMRINAATMHLEHKPGERIQIDFAGKKLDYIDQATGEIISCPVLVCVLPFSGYSYVEALPSATQEHLFPALGRCMNYFGGITENVLSDNMKQWVNKSHRYEPVFSDVCEQWSLYYNTSLSATRVAKPKDKPTVENQVHITYMRIYAPMRHETFFSLNEINHRILTLLEIHNRTCMQKRTYSRYDRFIQMEQPLLRALPAEPFMLKHTAMAKVQKNYHVVLGEDWHQYSVPYQYISKQVKIIYDTEEVEIFLGLKRIAYHKRNFRKNDYSTLAEHMPEKHQKYNETKGWDADYFLQKAKEIGENSLKVIERIIEGRTFAPQAFSSCRGLLRLSTQYGKERFESACKRALLSPRINYKLIENILVNNLDKQQDDQISLFPPIPDHENLRGPEYYS